MSWDIDKFFSWLEDESLSELRVSTNQDSQSVKNNQDRQKTYSDEASELISNIATIQEILR